MKKLKCDYCCNYGHRVADCPHMGQHLLDPSPRFNGLRGFVGLIDGKLVPLARASVSESSIDAFERSADR